MKLYIQIFKLLFNKFILRRSNGAIIKSFSEKMGIVYIKLAQMLATQNFGNLFTEKDRQILSSICDNCNPISYDEIEKILEHEYGEDLEKTFSYIEKKPVGSASISQVHMARLKSGEDVALKIKRKDITKSIDKDIKRIRKIVHRFGKIIKFKNIAGSDQALDLYLKWIEQETDFINERNNIKIYQKFADNVNEKVNGTKKIKVPKLYDNYCTNNIIVMEFIKFPTINKIELNEQNKRKINTALNSYIKSSFWALLNDQQVVFHGDPHSGNICIDEDENIYFLDMGLLCSLNKTDAKLCKDFFLTAYSGNYEKMYNMLIPYGNMNKEKKQEFKNDCQKYCEEIKKKDVTCYFIDMVNVCLNYEFVPPNFLFSMAKAFVCLNGISNFSNNHRIATELLQEQVMEFLIKRSLNDCKEIVIDSLHIAPKALENCSKYGVINTIHKVSNNKMKMDIKDSLENLKEMCNLIKRAYQDEMIAHDNKKTKHL